VQTVWYRLFRLLGWRGEYQAPSGCKFIIVVAPRTSDLDFVIGFTSSRADALPFSNFSVKRLVFPRGIGRYHALASGGITESTATASRAQFVDRVANEFARRPQNGSGREIHP
jgi:hypothetical protein